jgi:hypothetical protein
MRLVGHVSHPQDLAALALVAQPANDAAAEAHPCERVAAAGLREALLGRRSPRRVAADQHGVDRPVTQPCRRSAGRSPLRAGRDGTAARAELQRDDRRDAAQIKPGRSPLASSLDVRQEALDVQVAPAPAQPRVAAVMRVAELAAAHANERTARDTALADPGPDRARLAGEVLEGRLARGDPALAVRSAQLVLTTSSTAW